MFEQVANAPTYPALAQPDGRRASWPSPMLPTECRDADAEQLGGLLKRLRTALPQALDRWEVDLRMRLFLIFWPSFRGSIEQLYERNCAR